MKIDNIDFKHGYANGLMDAAKLIEQDAQSLSDFGEKELALSFVRKLKHMAFIKQKEALDSVLMK